MRVAVLAILIVGTLCASVHADEVVLRNGGHIVGIIVERTPEAVTLEVGPGRVTIAASRIERIISGRSALMTYEQRAREIAPGNIEGWLDLADWARNAGLETQAREAAERALALSPASERANRSLGRVPHAGQWMTQEEAYRAQGLVPFEGSWVTAGERARIQEAREVRRESEARAGAAESEARAREAEARAAEANARAAEANAAQQASPWGYGGYGYGYAAPCTQGCDHPGGRAHAEPRQRPEPLPTPKPTTSSVAGPSKPRDSSPAGKASQATPGNTSSLR